MHSLVNNNATEQVFLLKKDDYHLASCCFNITSPNIAFINSIIEKKIPGKIFVDYPGNPQSAYVLTEGPYGFVSKNLNINRIPSIEHLIKNKQSTDFKLMLDSSEIITKINLKKTSVIERLSLHFNIKKMIKSNISYPQGFSLQFIDNILFEKCLWKELMRSIFGTRENYLTYGAGYCLLYNGQVVSESHAIISKDFAELGVVTDPLFRNLGLSVIVCHALLLYCLDRGLHATWSCDALNKPSFKLAFRLGFENICRYTALISA